MTVFLFFVAPKEYTCHIFRFPFQALPDANEGSSGMRLHSSPNESVLQPDRGREEQSLLKNLEVGVQPWPNNVVSDRQSLLVSFCAE